MVQFDYIFFTYCAVAAVIPPSMIIRYCYKTEQREEAAYEAMMQAHLDGTDEAGIRRRCRQWLRRSCCKIDGSEPTLTGRVCPICLGDFTIGDKVWVLPCTHAYHVQCLDIMLKESRPEDGKIFRCPICRVELGIADQLHSTLAAANPTPRTRGITSGNRSVVVTGQFADDDDTPNNHSNTAYGPEAYVNGNPYHIVDGGRGVDGRERSKTSCVAVLARGRLVSVL
ncbi:hypothetical protein Pmar_PMAR001819 [Perkinsus marinus ATCC 50983]|uniref:RING-type domain-containing protein n=1 Tax=Perkinsus marinus (strain ATCC 50983 / TXsc) TaxID=423536 RepID=C5LJQ8_PERM5|nr:hypothetical protein Pmar_PMAR001819 [Perkinsus marinus ATCC 50983]EER03075.1 hypothetical protein Pmar_PMAR001819 [Perkinsus marinus ATCC 50983]|eukprot:XP_002771259.1 hypothetical protein Pmar_PMAR001819 [Perkinsus marinus ATCC 50983]